VEAGIFSAKVNFQKFVKTNIIGKWESGLCKSFISLSNVIWVKKERRSKKIWVRLYITKKIVTSCTHDNVSGMETTVPCHQILKNSRMTTPTPESYM
jgi:hypothetical protein